MDDPQFAFKVVDFQMNYSVTTFSSVNVTAVVPYWKSVLIKWTSIIILFNLIFLMVGMGAATCFTEIFANLKKPWGSVIGMVCQFGIFPAIGMGISLVANLPPYQAMGLLILCSSPGGAFSNFFVYWLDGDLALSLLMTATSSILAFGGMPLNMLFYSHFWIEGQILIPYTNVLLSMAFATVPALVGMFIRHYTRLWATRITKLCSVLGWVGALVAAAFSVLVYWDSLIFATLSMWLSAALLPIIGFCCAFILAKLLCFDNCISRTIGIETSCQNLVVAYNVILFSYSDFYIRSEMVVFPLLYGIMQIFEVLLFIVIYRCYKFLHRNDVTQEIAKSVIDTTVLMKVPTPQEEAAPRNGRLYAAKSEVESTSKYWKDIRTIDDLKENVSDAPESSIRLLQRDQDGDPIGVPSRLDINARLSQRNLPPGFELLRLGSPRPGASHNSQSNQILKSRSISLKFPEDGNDSKYSPPRSPSTNEGYGFPTFKTEYRE